MEIKCAELSGYYLQTHLGSTEGMHVEAALQDDCLKMIFIVLMYGQKNKRLIDISLQCDLDKHDHHWAARDAYERQQESKQPLHVNMNMYPANYSIVVTGFGLAGAFAEYFASDLIDLTKRRVSVVTFASPRAGGYSYYRGLQQKMNVIHHDWMESYPPRICGFYVKRRTLWDGRQFRVMGKTIVKSTSMLSRQFWEQRNYFHQLSKLMQTIGKTKPCDPI